MPHLEIEHLFQQMLLHREQTADPASLGAWLRQQIIHKVFPDLSHLPFSPCTYTRTRVAQESLRADHHYEALILRWDEQAKTSIHGHPAFSFYAVISGCFEMDFFTHQGVSGLRYEGSQRFRPGEVIWSLGQQGRYDNFIHRVTCLESGCTFHVYSDDGRKGCQYT